MTSTNQETPEQRAERIFKEDEENRRKRYEQQDAEMEADDEFTEWRTKMMRETMINGRKGCNTKERAIRIKNLLDEKKKYEEKYSGVTYNAMDDLLKGISNKMSDMLN
jgi:hypothetical protein